MFITNQLQLVNDDFPTSIQWQYISGLIFHLFWNSTLLKYISFLNSVSFMNFELAPCHDFFQILWNIEFPWSPFCRNYLRFTTKNRTGHIHTEIKWDMKIMEISYCSSSVHGLWSICIIRTYETPQTKTSGLLISSKHT